MDYLHAESLQKLSQISNMTQTADDGCGGFADVKLAGADTHAEQSAESWANCGPKCLGSSHHGVAESIIFASRSSLYLSPRRRRMRDDFHQSPIPATAAAAVIHRVTNKRATFYA